MNLSIVFIKKILLHTVRYFIKLKKKIATKRTCGHSV